MAGAWQSSFMVLLPPNREVAEVVCDLVGCVRIENLLGGTELLRDAAERGLLSRPW